MIRICPYFCNIRYCLLIGVLTSCVITLHFLNSYNIHVLPESNTGLVEQYNKALKENYDSKKAPLQQSDTGTIQQSDTGTEQQFDIGTEQQFDTGTVQQSVMGTRQQSDMVTTQQSDTGSIQQSDMGTVQQFDMGTIQQSDTGTVQRSDRELILQLQQKIVDAREADITKCEQKFPKVLIIGVMKSGTGAFTVFLGLHPQVAMQFNMVSTMFFSKNYNRGFDWYLSQMPCSTKDQVTVEKAPQYFPNKLAPERVYEYNSTIKLILLVRHPIDRAVSHFLQQKACNPFRLHGDTFEENVLDEFGNINNESILIYQSSYIRVLEHWLTYFDLNQILIIDGDDFKNNTIRELQRTEQFLNIKPYINLDLFQYNTERNIYCIKRLNEEKDLCLPSGKGREHPDIDPLAREKLQQYFKPLNKEFMDKVGRQFDW